MHPKIFAISISCDFWVLSGCHKQVGRTLCPNSLSGLCFLGQTGWSWPVGYPSPHRAHQEWCFLFEMAGQKRAKQEMVDRVIPIIASQEKNLKNVLPKSERKSKIFFLQNSQRGWKNLSSIRRLKNLIFSSLLRSYVKKRFRSIFLERKKLSSATEVSYSWRWSPFRKKNPIHKRTFWPRGKKKKKKKSVRYFLDRCSYYVRLSLLRWVASCVGQYLKKKRGRFSAVRKWVVIARSLRGRQKSLIFFSRGEKATWIGRFGTFGCCRDQMILKNLLCTNHWKMIFCKYSTLQILILINKTSKYNFQSCLFIFVLKTNMF